MADVQTETETQTTGTPRGVAAPRAAGVWALLKEAVAGGEQDFTTGSLQRAVFLLSIPMILEMSMESVFGLLDALFVGRLGPDGFSRRF